MASSSTSAGEDFEDSEERPNLDEATAPNTAGPYHNTYASNREYETSRDDKLSPPNSLKVETPDSSRSTSTDDALSDDVPFCGLSGRQDSDPCLRNMGAWTAMRSEGSNGAPQHTMNQEASPKSQNRTVLMTVGAEPQSELNYRKRLGNVFDIDDGSDGGRPVNSSNPGPSTSPFLRSNEEGFGRSASYPVGSSNDVRADGNRPAPGE